jgi:hypothetical protein
MRRYASSAQDGESVEVNPVSARRTHDDDLDRPELPMGSRPSTRKLDNGPISNEGQPAGGLPLSIGLVRQVLQRSNARDRLYEEANIG